LDGGGATALDKRARLSLVLIVVALAVGALVASGVGAETPRKASIVPAPESAPTSSPGATARALVDVATPAEKKLWNDRGCVTCHGADAHGTNMGPDVVAVIPLYLAKHGSSDAAKKALVAYLVDPKNTPRLRADGATFMNPMPAIEKLFGGKREDADALADLLLRLAE